MSETGQDHQCPQCDELCAPLRALSGEPEQLVDSLSRHLLKHLHVLSTAFTHSPPAQQYIQRVLQAAASQKDSGEFSERAMQQVVSSNHEDISRHSVAVTLSRHLGSTSTDCGTEPSVAAQSSVTSEHCPIKPQNNTEPSLVTAELVENKGERTVPWKFRSIASSPRTEDCRDAPERLKVLKRGRPRKSHNELSKPCKGKAGSERAPRKRGRPPKASADLLRKAKNPDSSKKRNRKPRVALGPEGQFPEQEERPLPSSPPWTCPVCSLEHPSLQCLFVHVKQMHGTNRKFRCQFCDKGFGRASTRNLHEQQKVCLKTERRRTARPNSAWDKPFLCSQCANCYGSAAALRAHVSNVHSTESPFACDLCERSFKTKARLHEHVKTHSTLKPFMCELCSESFRHKSYLNRHLASGIHGGERKFQCQQCDRKFFLRKHLRQHQRVHTGEKPFGCGLCSFRTAWRYDVIMHTRKVHREQQPVVLRLDEAKPSSITSETKSEYKTLLSVAAHDQTRNSISVSSVPLLDSQLRVLGLQEGAAVAGKAEMHGHLKCAVVDSGTDLQRHLQSEAVVREAGLQEHLEGVAVIRETGLEGHLESAAVGREAELQGQLLSSSLAGSD